MYWYVLCQHCESLFVEKGKRGGAVLGQWDHDVGRGCAGCACCGSGIGTLEQEMQRLVGTAKNTGGRVICVCYVCAMSRSCPSPSISA